MLRGGSHGGGVLLRTTVDLQYSCISSRTSRVASYIAIPPVAHSTRTTPQRVHRSTYRTPRRRPPGGAPVDGLVDREMARVLIVTSAVVAGAHGWGAGHDEISKQALLLQPEEIQTSFNSTTIHFLGTDGTAQSMFSGQFSEAGDIVAGPCAPNTSTPCSPAAVEAKLTFRDYCYAEDKSGHYTKPWPYAIPDCISGQPPQGWSACLPPPHNWTWLYHYFTETPAADLGIEGRGAIWYLEQTTQAFADNNVTKAALHLGCFAHGIEDRSSPYHAFGGFDEQKSAIEAKYNLTAICKSHWPEMPPSQRPRCEILFWSPHEPTAKQFDAPGYKPLLLGPTVVAAGTAVGARMAELAATSREIAARPETGFVASHLNDDQWWLGTASNATIVAMAEMGRQSTRLVADVIYTAWVLANSTKPNVNLPVRAPLSTSHKLSDAEWAQKVRAAAKQDRNNDEGTFSL